MSPTQDHLAVCVTSTRCLALYPREILNLHIPSNSSKGSTSISNNRHATIEMPIPQVSMLRISLSPRLHAALIHMERHTDIRHIMECTLDNLCLDHLLTLGSNKFNSCRLSGHSTSVIWDLIASLSHLEISFPQRLRRQSFRPPSLNRSIQKREVPHPNLQKRAMLDRAYTLPPQRIRSHCQSRELSQGHRTSFIAEATAAASTLRIRLDLL